MSDKKRKKKDILRRLLLGALAVVLGLGVYAWNARNVMGNQMPMPFGIGLSRILSGSMEPVLKVDDLVVIRETAEIEVGDILVYQDGNILVIHRLVGMDGDMLILQGDANNTADEPISRTAVKGKLVFTIPGAGAVVDIFRQPLMIAAVLGGAVWILEGSFRKEKKKDSEELAAMEEEIRQLMKELKEE